MFKVYWTDSAGKSYGKEFIDMSEALAFTQRLRNELQRLFVTLCSENPDCTSKPGVSGLESDEYEWTKRR
jgi:hypothetical protein